MPRSRSSQPAELSTSFIFAIKELSINDDTQEGGIPPNAEYDHWIPPVYTNGYFTPRLPDLYRWDNGVISETDVRYQDVLHTLVPYRTTTVFYCDQLLNFRATGCDPTEQTMANSAEYRWYRLRFENEDGCSRVDVAGQEEYLPVSGSSWVNNLGLSPYCSAESQHPPVQSLAGDVAIILALIAMSCKHSDLKRVLVHDRAWHRYRWRGHHHRHGRRDKRGILVEIFLDPDNPQGSTYDILHYLEMYNGALIY